MNAGKQAAWLLTALIALACSGWYFASSTAVIKLDDQTLSTITDVIISDLTVHKYDTKGHLANYLKTPLMQHTPLNNSHWFKNPDIMIAQPNQPAWTIRSQEATSIRGGDEITFNRNVVIHQGHDQHTQESTLTTEEITYFPKTKFAMTKKDVTFVQPGNTIKSTGMNAYLAEKRVQLLSQARGTYEPNKG